MVSLLKTFGKGLLYVIGMPFFLVALAIFGVVGLLQFIFQIFKSIIFFFTGQKFFPELEEDKELRLKLEKEKAPASIPSEVHEEVSQPVPDIIIPLKEEEIPVKEEEPVITKQEEPLPQEEKEPLFEEVSTSEQKEEPSIESVCFDYQEEKAPVEEEIKPELEEEIQTISPLSDLLNDGPVETELKTSESTPNEEEEEELETYVPRSSKYNENVDEEDTDIGVDINFDL